MLQAARIFGNHMVLQQKKKIRIWGSAQIGETVEALLEFGGSVQKSTAQADSSGHWQLVFPPQPAARNGKITVRAKDDRLIWEDVLIGEVWIAGGQSNMEYPMEFDAEKEAALAEKMSREIRFFDVPEISYAGEEQDRDYGQYGFWRCCTQEDLPYFSAVGYYFARDLEEAGQGPVGIIGCNWGGTACVSWLDPKRLLGRAGEVWIREYEAGLAKITDPEEERQQFRTHPQNDRTDILCRGKDQRARLWRRIMDQGSRSEEELCLLERQLQELEAQLPKIQLQEPKGQQPKPEERQLEPGERQPEKEKPAWGPYSEHRPGALYEQMVRPLAPYPVRGVLWYQGESDHVHPEIYGEMLKELIACWRELWQEELLFLLVQLAPFHRWIDSSGERYPILRKCQEMAARTVPGVYLASSSDAGMRWDVHPKKKRPIGIRLGRLARKYIYGEMLLADAPLALGARRKGNGVQIAFAHAQGLHVPEDAFENGLHVSEDAFENGLRVSGDVTAFLPFRAIDRDGREMKIKDVRICGEELYLELCQKGGQLQPGARILFAMDGYYEVRLYNEAQIPALPFALEVE